MRAHGATLAFAVLFCCQALFAAGCPQRPNLGNNPRKYVGHYRNFAYGFSTVIPRGYVGLDTNDPSYQRGFDIFLPRNQGFVVVIAETNNADDLDLHAANLAQLKYVSPEAKNLDPQTSTRAFLDKQPMDRVAATFACSNTPGAFTVVSLLSASQDQRFTYQLTWTGPSAAVDVGKNLLQQLVSQWRFVPAK